jgi:hypothetical protein
MSGTGSTDVKFEENKVLPEVNPTSVGDSIFGNKIQYSQVGGKKKRSVKNKRRSNKKNKSTKRSNKKNSSNKKHKKV